MELKAAVCDDSAADRYLVGQMLRKTAEDAGIQIAIYEYASGEELIKDIFAAHDILFLDIQMQGMDGQETADQFRRQNKNAVLAFVTGVVMPTPDMFRVYPYRYLLKQEMAGKGRGDMEDILREAVRRQERVYLKAVFKNKMMQIDTDRILYISLRKRGCQIWLNQETEENPVNCNSRLAEIYEELKAHDFVYAHNSYIVNLKHVIKAEGNVLELAGGTTLTISRSRKEEFCRSFARYLGRKYNKKQ